MNLNNQTIVLSEIILGIPKRESSQWFEDDFNEVWDPMAADVAAAREQGLEIDLPVEWADAEE